MLDGGAPFYDTYATADGGFMAVGAMEPAFYAELLAGLGLADDPDLPAQYDPSGWAELRRAVHRAVRRARPGTSGRRSSPDLDACVAPVLAPGEAHQHPHNAARGTFVEVGGEIQPAPAPRFDRTPDRPTGPRTGPGTGRPAGRGNPHQLAVTDLTVCDVPGSGEPLGRPVPAGTAAVF